MTVDAAGRRLVATRMPLPAIGSHDAWSCATGPYSPAMTGTAGFAGFAAADERFCFALPPGYDHAHAAPLLCAGLIGFRAWRAAGEGSAKRLGLYGFGAAAHIICQVAAAKGQEVFAFTRQSDEKGQAFARRMGAVWLLIDGLRLQTQVECVPLLQGNEGLQAVRSGIAEGAIVLVP